MARITVTDTVLREWLNKEINSYNFHLFSSIYALSASVALTVLDGLINADYVIEDLGRIFPFDDTNVNLFLQAEHGTFYGASAVASGNTTSFRYVMTALDASSLLNSSSSETNTPLRQIHGIRIKVGTGGYPSASAVDSVFRLTVLPYMLDGSTEESVFPQTTPEINALGASALFREWMVSLFGSSAAQYGNVCKGLLSVGDAQVSSILQSLSTFSWVMSAAPSNMLVRKLVRELIVNQSIRDTPELTSADVDEMLDGLDALEIDGSSTTAKFCRIRFTTHILSNLSTLTPVQATRLAEYVSAFTEIEAYRVRLRDTLNRMLSILPSQIDATYPT